MPASILDYKLTDTEDKIVNIILNDTIMSLRQVLRIDGKLIKKIILHKLIELS